MTVGNNVLNQIKMEEVSELEHQYPCPTSLLLGQSQWLPQAPLAMMILTTMDYILRLGAKLNPFFVM